MLRARIVSNLKLLGNFRILAYIKWDIWEMGHKSKQKNLICFINIHLKGIHMQHNFVSLYFTQTESGGIDETHQKNLDPSVTGPKFWDYRHIHHHAQLCMKASSSMLSSQKVTFAASCQCSGSLTFWAPDFSFYIKDVQPVLYHNA